MYYYLIHLGDIILHFRHSVRVRPSASRTCSQNPPVAGADSPMPAFQSFCQFREAASCARLLLSLLFSSHVFVVHYAYKCICIFGTRFSLLSEPFLFCHLYKPRLLTQGYMFHVFRVNISGKHALLFIMPLAS